MTKDELKEIAQHGVRTILRQMEDKIAALHAEFPEQFLSPTAPLLARPELKNGSLDPARRSAAGGGDTKRSRVVPYLRAHGPSATRAILAASGMRSGGTLSTVLAQLRKAGEVRKVGPGVWAATDALTPAQTTTKTTPTKKTTKKTTKTTTKTTGWSAAKRAARASSKQLLDAVGTDGPLTAGQLHAHGFRTGQMLGPLVRRGYLKRQGDGYARTSKVFVVDERKKATRA
jgi:hypothetical protein